MLTGSFEQEYTSMSCKLRATFESSGVLAHFEVNQLANG